MKQYIKPEINIIMFDTNTFILAGSAYLDATGLDGTSYGGNASDGSVINANAKRGMDFEEWDDDYY